MQKVTRKLLTILTLIVTYLVSFTSVVNGRTNVTPIENQEYYYGSVQYQYYFLLAIAFLLILVGIVLLTIKKRPSGLVKTKVFHYKNDN